MGILIKNNIVNQKGTPAFYESSLATRPIANIQGRMFIDTDVPSTGIYRDNGTSWDQVADSGAGTTGTLQQVTTNGSSTNVGISVSANGIGIGTTIPGINRLDIHTGSGINATFNGTGTTNSALQFQLAGAGKWNIGNLYNSAANDFIITDVVNSLNRITVKNTGQTFIGSDTTSSGALVVNNATSDNHIVVLGANAPSLRFRNAGTGGTLNTGIGISTATNNFIQGSVSGDYCLFNSSTTASPILFGIYDSGAGNTVEAARISAARNFLIGTTTDAGFKLSVNGSSNFNGSINGTTINLNSLATLSPTNGTQGIYVLQTNTGGSLYVGLDNSAGTTFNNGAYAANFYTDAQKMVFSTANVARLTLAASGSATFSSSIAIGNTVTAAVGVASTHKVSIIIGGVQYYLLASNI
jgi:hypothetical protein